MAAPHAGLGLGPRQCGGRHCCAIGSSSRRWWRHWFEPTGDGDGSSPLAQGQVENQVGLIRERFFTPRPRVKSLDELNAWLLDKCVAHAKAHRHPEETDKTIWEMLEAERPRFVPYVGPFDGFHCVPASVSKTCTARFDNNKYSVLATAVGRPVEVHAYAARIVIRQGEPSRRHWFERDGERGCRRTCASIWARPDGL